MALYNETVMEHFMNPQNVGDLENADGTGVYGSPVCGDMMQIQIKVKDEKIVDAKCIRIILQLNKCKLRHGVFRLIDLILQYDFY